MATTTFSSAVVAKGGIVTNEQLPATASNGATSGSLAVFDLGGSKVLAYSNGTNWINATTGAVIPVGPPPPPPSGYVFKDSGSFSPSLTSSSDCFFIFSPGGTSVALINGESGGTIRTALLTIPYDIGSINYASLQAAPLIPPMDPGYSFNFAFSVPGFDEFYVKWTGAVGEYYQRYTIDSGWNVASLSVLNNYSGNYGDFGAGNPIGFSADGTKYFTTSASMGGTQINQYPVSTPYQINTVTTPAVATASLGVTTAATQFTPSGLNVYALYVQSGVVYVSKFDLASAFDVSTLTTDTTTFFNLTPPNPTGAGIDYAGIGSILFSANEFRMNVVGQNIATMSINFAKFTK